MKYYTIYEIDKENNDIRNVGGSENRETIANTLQIRVDNLHLYTMRDLDTPPRKQKIIDNKYYVVMIDKD